MTKHIKISLFVFTGLLLFFCSLFFGAEKIPFATFIRFFQYDDFTSLLVWQIRLIRTLIVLMSGALLAGAGCVFQGFFRNPLADSALLGVSSGATLGAVTAIITGLPFFYLFSFAGAVLAVCLAYIIASCTNTFYHRRLMNQTTSLLLCGIALSSLFSALTALLIITHDNSLHKIYLWTLGSFNAKEIASLLILAPFFIFSIVLFFFLRRPLDILAFGEESAISLGVNMRLYRPLIIIGGAAATAGAVCVSGTIGFIGLMAPHFARKLFGSSHKTLIWYSMATGSLLLLLSDILARTLSAPLELPIGILTAFLGVPFFLVVLLTGEKHGD